MSEELPYKNNYFDYKLASVGALSMGTIVYYINSEYGVDAAAIAATKQAVYTFLVGGSMAKLCENIATRFRKGFLSRSLSVVVPSAVTIGLTYLVHSLRGTPEPFESTLPT